MSHARFPSTHLILPEFRHAALKPQKDPNPIKRCKNKQEFQRLIELSLHYGIVLQIVTHTKKSPIPQPATTGIIKHINPGIGRLEVQTLEGTRYLLTEEIYDVISFE